MEDLKEVFGEHWEDITSAKLLSGAILHGIRILRRTGDNERADKWENKLKRMPRRMTKEGINVVLMAICLELGFI